MVIFGSNMAGPNATAANTRSLEQRSWLDTWGEMGEGFGRAVVNGVDDIIDCK